MPNPKEVFFTINGIQQEYYNHWVRLKLHSGQRQQNYPSTRNWRPPTVGVTKINTDAAFDKARSIAWAGFILRDEKGEILTGSTKTLAASSPLMAEALSFREALMFASNLGIQHITVESDCLELVQACRDEVKRGEIQNIVGDIRALKRGFQSAAFTWIGREGNQVAHLLAKLAKIGNLPLNWTWNLPSSLSSAVDVDKASAASAGFPFDPGTPSPWVPSANE